MELPIEIERGKGDVRIYGPSSPRYLTGVISLTLIILCAVFAIRRQDPPEARPASATAVEFASGRAMKHIKEIAKNTHPIGSVAHAEVRDYILKELTGLGLNPEVQRSLVVNQQRGGSYGSTVVANIIGRMTGIDSRRAILLACHYDSVPTGLGASDDGSGVAALLEVIRALKSDSRLKNDLVFLFTDAEEIGMLGAKAFMDEHPLARQIGVALNFEARGIGGPSIMFETSDGNDWLIREFAKAAPQPVANSLTYDLYKLLPNATDMTIFKNAGLQGFNFAYIAGVSSYHTVRDSYDNIDERSLQHHGSYALSLARHFGNLSDWPEPAGNAVYFDLFSSVLVFYSGKLVLPLMTLGLLCFAGLIVLGLRMQRLTIRGLAFGILVFFLNAIGVGVLLMIAWFVIQNSSSNPMTGSYHSSLYVTGFLLLTVALSGTMLSWLSRKTKIENVTVGALFWWAISMLLLCLYVPGGSYLFTWPLLLMVLVLGVIFLLKEEMTSMKSLAILTLPSLSGVILIAPLIRLMVTGFGMGVVGMLMILVVFLLALHHAHLKLLIEAKPWLLTSVLGTLGFCFIGAAILITDVSIKQPKRDHIVYTLNSDTGRAIWASADERPDEWTSQFYSSGAEKASLAEYFPWGEGSFLKAEAPPLSLSPPEIILLSDKAEGGLRTLRFKIRSLRKAPALAIYWKQELVVEGLAVNEKRVVKQFPVVSDSSSRYRKFYYVGLPGDGIELSLAIKTSDPLELKLEDWSYGLPETPSQSFSARPDYIFAAPYPYSDCTVVMRSVKF
jgi:Peptidase family M28